MADDTKLADALAEMADEPLLDVEKKLVAVSLVLGVVLLVVLGVLSYWLTGTH
jgi:hypothetical protein